MSKNESNKSQKEESNNDLLSDKSKESKEEEKIVEEVKEEKKIVEESKDNSDSKNNSKYNKEQNNTNNEESKENSNSNENSDEKNKVKLKDDEVLVEVMDQGVNTDELNSSELERLVKENKELQELLNDDKGNLINEDKIFNIEHDTTEISPIKKALIEELTKNDEVKEILAKSNIELSTKIKLSEKKFQEIMDKIGEKKSENVEEKLELKIKELEKEIKANNSETERYKKLIESLKDKIGFKEGIERTSNLQKILKQETLKNIELKYKLNTLTKINKYQARYMENYQKQHKIKEKEEQLTKEISQNKKFIKDYNNKYLKLDRFTKAAHARIMGVRIFVGKIINQPKKEEKKIFTNEETKDTLGVITNLKAQINEKRKELDEIQKKSESKIHELLVHNKQIELDYLENKRIYKSLLCKKYEINKKIIKLRNINKDNNQINKKSNENINKNISKYEKK